MDEWMDVVDVGYGWLTPLDGRMGGCTLATPFVLDGSIRRLVYNN